MSDAMNPATLITVDDPTPTPPDGIPAVARYLGVAYHANLPTSDMPFVVTTLAEAHDLVRALRDGARAAVRRWVSGVVVEHEIPPSLPAHGVELALWKRDEGIPDFDAEYPTLFVRLGPRGGIYHETA